MSKPSAEMPFNEAGYLKDLSDYWFNLTFRSGGDWNEDMLHSGVNWLYALKKQQKPIIILKDSPFACIQALKKLRTAKCNVTPLISSEERHLKKLIYWQYFLRKVGSRALKKKNRLGAWIISPFSYPDYSWIRNIRTIQREFNWYEGWINETYECMLNSSLDACCYIAMRELFYFHNEALEKLLNFLESGCFLSIFLQGYAFISRRPEKTYLNHRDQLHRDNGPAVQWRDGSGLYCLNGICVPKSIVMTPAHKLDPLSTLKTRDLQVRGEIMLKVGFDRFMRASIDGLKWAPEQLK